MLKFVAKRLKMANPSVGCWNKKRHPCGDSNCLEGAFSGTNRREDLAKALKSLGLPTCCAMGITGTKIASSVSSPKSLSFSKEVR
jgi:hypothetical protein